MTRNATKRRQHRPRSRSIDPRCRVPLRRPPVRGEVTGAVCADVDQLLGEAWACRSAVPPVIDHSPHGHQHLQRRERWPSPLVVKCEADQVPRMSRHRVASPKYVGAFACALGHSGRRRPPSSNGLLQVSSAVPIPRWTTGSHHATREATLGKTRLSAAYGSYHNNRHNGV